MNYERAGRAELRQRGCNPVDYIRGENTEHLRFGAAGLVSGPRRLKTVRFTICCRAGMAGALAACARGGEQKTDANFMHRRPATASGRSCLRQGPREHPRSRCVEADERLPMLGNASTRRRRDNRRAGG